MSELTEQKQKNEKMIDQIFKKLDALEAKLSLVIQSINEQLTKER
jgi:hypothetical protein